MPASQTPQSRPSPPQGLSEEALKEALQVPSIWVESQDVQEAKCQEVEREVALLSPFIQREVLRCGHGLAQADPVILPKQVNSDVLNLLLDYCRFHRAPGRSDKERKLFDEKFIRLDTRRLCELTSAADALDMKPLVDLTSRALARMIEGKSAEEIRETFHLPDDLTEEEKLEPVKNATADPRIRLLNRLYAKKRKELAHKKAIELAAEARAREQAQPAGDDRPLEDLLTFIGTEPAGGKPKSKQKKKRSKKKSGMLLATSMDSEASELLEARPSSDPLPVSSAQSRLPEQSRDVPSTIPSPSLDHMLSVMDTAQLVSSQLQQTADPADGIGWQQMSGSVVTPTFPAATQVAGCAGAACVDVETDITAEDDAALLADMQGFASALGCDWQVRRPDMMSLGTLPLLGAHITTLTSLANFKPSHTDGCSSNHQASDHDGSSWTAGEESQESELDTDDELEAAYDDRQAANLRESNFAYDIAMSRVAAEDNRASFRPHWHDDPTHASHASFDDWATNASHANGASSTLTSHGSFSFANGCHDASKTAPRQQDYPANVLSPWPESHQAAHIQEQVRSRIDISAVQELFHDFLQKTGLDDHLEVRALPSRDPSPHYQRDVAVQTVLPCGTFMKIQLN